MASGTRLCLGLHRGLQSWMGVLMPGDQDVHGTHKVEVEREGQRAVRSQCLRMEGQRRCLEKGCPPAGVGRRREGPCRAERARRDSRREDSGFVDSVSQKLRETMTRWVGVIVEGAPGGARGNLSRASPVLGSSASSGEKAVSCWVPCWMPCELGDLAIALLRC